MKILLKKYRIIFALLAIIPLWIAWDIVTCFCDPVVRGKTDAMYDYSRGIKSIQVYGLPGGCTYGYNQLLLEKYHVLRINLGCTSTFEEALYQDSYNEKATELINKRYGKDIFKEISDEACRSKK